MVYVVFCLREILFFYVYTSHAAGSYQKKKKINTSCSKFVGIDFGYIEMNTSLNHFAFGFAFCVLQHWLPVWLVFNQILL